MLNAPDALVPPPEQPVFTLPETPLSDVVRLTPQRARILAFLETTPALCASEIARETGVSTGVILAMEKAGLLAKYMAARSPMAEGGFPQKSCSALGKIFELECRPASDSRCAGQLSGRKIFSPSFGWKSPLGKQRYILTGSPIWRPLANRC